MHHYNHYQYERKLCKKIKKINYKLSCHLYNIKKLKNLNMNTKKRTQTNAKPQSHMQNTKITFSTTQSQHEELKMMFKK